MRAKFWYSAKQANCMNAHPVGRMLRELNNELGEPETQAFVTLPVAGEVIEVAYTEAYGGSDNNYWPNWDDAVLLGEGDFPVRVENLPSSGE